MAPTTIDAREHLVRAIEADLVGPHAGASEFDTSDELLTLPPSRWYLTGFLAPMEAREIKEPVDDEVGAGPDLDSEDGAVEPGPKRKHMMPASIGLSVLLPAATEGDDAVDVTASWARYGAEEHEERDASGEVHKVTQWRRVPRTPVGLRAPLDPRRLSQGIEIPGAPGIWLQGRLAVARAPGLEAGTRALSLFLVNRQGKGETKNADERFLFQAKLEVAYAEGFRARPNWRGEDTRDGDEQIADLQFRDRFEWAVGHGVATEAHPDENGAVRRVGTTWIPRAEVPAVKARRLAGLETGMLALAAAAEKDGGSLAHALDALPAAFEAWIGEQEAIDPGSENRRKTRDRLVVDARRARQRIEEGIALLCRDAEVQRAFALMNRAMAMQAECARPGESHSWRLFQLAFVLLNLPSVADEGHPDREQVELIYFPTGGGKTEAYLGVIAFVLVLRRLRARGRPDGGDGVAVLLRYTLRLLTIDQLRRAASLVCALELLRREQPEAIGKTRFAVGLWVGKSATANTMKEVAEQVTRYKASGGKAVGSPFPLTACPWCKSAIARNSMRLVPSVQKATSVQVHCQNDDCPFHVDDSPDGLPVLFVDEQIYRELPAFLVATVDKLAMLPWRGETGMLFGRALWREDDRFFGPLDKAPAGATRLPTGLLPPELIVQDELHLISGPLGTMVGLYETVIEALCTRPHADHGPTRPKVIAATATVRQATEQIRALFGRIAPPAVFPPPGVDDGETFFAQVDRGKPGRLYIGLAASGRPMKLLLLRSYVAALSAAAMTWQMRGDKTADGYMTLVGYFNSLRELGGMRRLVEDEVAWRAARQGQRRPTNAGRARWFRDRVIGSEPAELTSRETTARIAETKARLDLGHDQKGSVDVLLASNMISVGVDIDRLGLMVIAGQPKTTAEYIQASSRVGRRPNEAPGLVMTCFNVYRPRDRSHYEHFTAYHESFYRNVEASSVTPFSGPALERGLAGALVALVRHLDPVMTPNAAAAELPDHRQVGEAAVRVLVARARCHRSLSEDEVVRRAGDLEQLGKALLDTWETLIREARAGAGSRRYSPFDRDHQGGRPLLFTVLDPDADLRSEKERRFAAPTSMRDVESTVHLWLERQPLGGRQR